MYIYFLLGVISVRYNPQMNAFCVFGEGINEAEIQRKVDEIYNPNKESWSLVCCTPE